MKIKLSTFLLALLLIGISIFLSAQQTAGVASVTIVVTDPTGAVIPHAQINLSPDPKSASNLETSDNGTLQVPLAPGNYYLSLDVPRFKHYSKNFQVDNASNQSVDAHLQPDGVGTAVYVGGPNFPVRVEQDPLGSDPHIDQTFARQSRLNAMAMSAAGQTISHFDGQTWWDHVKVLADDKLEGRDTGSPGERAAQAYAVEQLKNAGAEPAGIDGFYQPVKFVSRQIVEKDCSLALIRDGKREPLTLGEDAIIGTRVMPAPEVEAALVFVGYGLKVPEQNYDDFAGLDVHGKIVVILSGSPSDIPGALAAHYQTAAERWKVLRAAGAVGIVSLSNPASMDIPWSRIALNRTHLTMDLDYPEFNETEGAKLAVTINPASAEKFFAGSGHSFEEIAALGKDRKPLPHFPLAVSLAAKTKVK